MLNVFRDIKRHATLLESMGQKCIQAGAPAFMKDLMDEISRKTSFSMESGNVALLQPFLSGRISYEDKINISEATGYVLDMKSVTTLDDYVDSLSSLHARITK